VGLLGKLKFWKRDKDFAATDPFSAGKDPFGGGKDPFGGLGTMPGSSPPGDFGAPAMNDSFPPSGFPQQPSFNQGSFAPGPSFSPQPVFAPSRESGTDMQVISAKLDAIRATLDSINQRVANLERVAYGEQEQQKGRYQW